MPDKQAKKEKPKYIPTYYDDKCPFCGSKERQKLFDDEDMGFVCLGCGSGFKKENGRWVHDPALNQPVVQWPKAKESEETNE